MNLQNYDIVFISWTGEFGKKLASYLAKNMFDFLPLQGWVSERDITAGAAWFNETQQALQKAKFGVVCLTPGSSKSSWLNFEAGFLYGRLNNCKLVNFGERLINPLQQIQAKDGTNPDVWVSLLEEMTQGRQSHAQCRTWVDRKFPELNDLLQQLEQAPYPYLREIDNTVERIQKAVDQLKHNAYARENICFQRVILDSYLEFQNRSETIESSYSLPASQYPHYLIYLQEKLKPKPHVKAIALINIEEQFWQQTMGREILRTSSDDSVRVFVFTSEKDFETTYPTLLEHARKYNVYAMSLTKLSQVLGDYSKDFSIINVSNSKLLAVYDDGIPEQKNICFIAETRTIDEYEKQFIRLLNLNLAVSIPNNANNDIADIEKYRNRIFRGLAPYERKNIEMSEYINVMDYDKHEEKHAYYQEMMQRMISICLEESRNHHQPLFEVLELGAGTGIFTMRLVTELPNVTKIDAIEIDWLCYHILKDKLREYADSNQIEINIYHEDSRTYNPPGQFDYIFSSFADHHIKRGDKEEYFDNVRRNLKPGGLLIVGDEFIAKHDPDDRNARDNALRAYHNHIIEKAKHDEEFVLVALEQAALESGLNEIGDFKVSCSQYEKFLQKAGFELARPPEKIGPPNRDDIGGVYVYTARLRS